MLLSSSSSSELSSLCYSTSQSLIASFCISANSTSCLKSIQQFQVLIQQEIHTPNWHHCSILCGMQNMWMEQLWGMLYLWSKCKCLSDWCHSLEIRWIDILPAKTVSFIAQNFGWISILRKNFFLLWMVNRLVIVLQIIFMCLLVLLSKMEDGLWVQHSTFNAHHDPYSRALPSLLKHHPLWLFQATTLALVLCQTFAAATTTTFSCSVPLPHDSTVWHTQSRPGDPALHIVVLLHGFFVLWLAKQINDGAWRAWESAMASGWRASWWCWRSWGKRRSCWNRWRAFLFCLWDFLLLMFWDH